MKDELSKKLLEYVENTKDFLLEQCPDVLQQAMCYEKINSIIKAVLFFVLFWTCIGTIYYAWKYPALDKYESRSIMNVETLIVACIFIIPCGICCLEYVMDLIKMYVAPKVYMIELIKSMIKD